MTAREEIELILKACCRPKAYTISESSSNSVLHATVYTAIGSLPAANTDELLNQLDGTLVVPPEDSAKPPQIVGTYKGQDYEIWLTTMEESPPATSI
ncbi:hypothetical protein [Blastopirellula marina]|uniref:hypothetical protein n=1 Tax=Blastopirellula marina TaxID=124 RepID=UPI0011B03874|nr:hypothetical protein [Blastopirellula marina]